MEFQLKLLLEQILQLISLDHSMTQLRIAVLLLVIVYHSEMELMLSSLREQSLVSKQMETKLEFISSEDRGDWVNVGMGIKHAGLPGGYQIWDSWSMGGSTYGGKQETQAEWDSFGLEGKLGRTFTLGSVYQLAKEGGWTPPQLTREEVELLPLLTVSAPPRAITSARPAGPDGPATLDLTSPRR